MVSKDIIIGVRLPRVILGIIVGGILGITGAALQGLLNNQLVDPYFIGSSTGGALFLSLFSISFPLPLFLRPVIAFLGSLFSMSIVYLLAFRKRFLRLSLILAGIAFNFFASSIVMLLMVISKRQLPEILYSLMGSLSFILEERTIPLIIAFSLLVILFSILIFLKSRPLDVLSFEEETAKSLGVNPEKLTKEIFIYASLLVGISVAFAGCISFIGLVVPHIARLLLGPRHSDVLPSAMLLGAGLLLVADLASRTFLPIELPVSTVTSLFGVPFFLYLLEKKI